VVGNGVYMGFIQLGLGWGLGFPKRETLGPRKGGVFGVFKRVKVFSHIGEIFGFF